MRYLLVASLLVSSSSVSAAPAHKSARKAATPAICASLASDYDAASKKLAMLKVEGIIDDSAPRATMRETESTNIIDQARITMDIMKNNGCKSPTAAPSADRYITAAFACETAATKQSTAALQAAMQGNAAPDSPSPAECDQSKWVAN
jgi:hypothetical protein